MKSINTTAALKQNFYVQANQYGNLILYFRSNSIKQRWSFSWRRY